MATMGNTPPWYVLQLMCGGHRLDNVSTILMTIIYVSAQYQTTRPAETLTFNISHTKLQV